MLEYAAVLGRGGVLDENSVVVDFVVDVVVVVVVVEAGLLLLLDRSCSRLDRLDIARLVAWVIGVDKWVGTSTVSTWGHTGSLLGVSVAWSILGSICVVSKVCVCWVSWVNEWVNISWCLCWLDIVVVLLLRLLLRLLVVILE